jgi:hypothetical protein
MSSKNSKWKDGRGPARFTARGPGVLCMDERTFATFRDQVIEGYETGVIAELHLTAAETKKNLPKNLPVPKFNHHLRCQARFKVP